MITKFCNERLALMWFSRFYLEKAWKIHFKQCKSSNFNISYLLFKLFPYPLGDFPRAMSDVILPLASRVFFVWDRSSVDLCRGDITVRTYHGVRDLHDWLNYELDFLGCKKCFLAPSEQSTTFNCNNNRYNIVTWFYHLNYHLN